MFSYVYTVYLQYTHMRVTPRTGIDITRTHYVRVGTTVKSSLVTSNTPVYTVVLGVIF